MGLLHIYLILFSLLLVEGIGIPGIPFEAAFLAAGYFIERGEMSFISVVLVGSLGNLIGNVIGYWFGSKAIPLLLKKSKDNKFSSRGQEIALYWFNRYGAMVVVISRWFGLIRTPTIVCAATMGMKPAPYIFYSAIGAFSWTLAWQYASWKGINIFLYWWSELLEYASLWVVITVVVIMVAIVCGVIYYCWRRKKRSQT